MAVNRWNLNPVRLPVPPRSRKVDSSHYSGLACVGCRTTGAFDRFRSAKARRLTSASAGRGLDPTACPREIRSFNMQSIMGFALRREQFAPWSDNLLEYRDPKRLP